MPKKTKKVRKLGICSVCKDEAKCTYPKKSKRPILQCDEFEPHKSLPEKKRSKSINVKNRSQDKFVSKETASYKGLCINCENRETCTFPKSDGGVWHCDEYR